MLPQLKLPHKIWVELHNWARSQGAIQGPIAIADVRSHIDALGYNGPIARWLYLVVMQCDRIYLSTCKDLEA